MLETSKNMTAIIIFGKSRVTPLEFPIQNKFKKTPGTVLEIVLNKCKF